MVSGRGLRFAVRSTVLSRSESDSRCYSTYLGGAVLGRLLSVNTRRHRLVRCHFQRMTIIIISFQTYGDYLLKAPFLSELREIHANAAITVLTNKRGGQVYPLIDSRLHTVTFDKTERPFAILKRLLSIPKADLLYLLDQHPASCIFSLVVRARHKIGWSQSVSNLFAGPQTGFREFSYVPRPLSELLALAFSERLIRMPDDSYEGHVELQLLPKGRKYTRLAQYRNQYSLAPAPPSSQKLIYCGTSASWVTRQLPAERWELLLNKLLGTFPDHTFLVDGLESVASKFAPTGRVQPLERSEDLGDLFRLISSVDAVICSDSFLTHLASWYDIPAVCFFGPASPHRFGPTAVGSSIVFHRPACSPCIQQAGITPCLAGYMQCLSFQAITPDEVCAGVSRALAARRKPA